MWSCKLKSLEKFKVLALSQRSRSESQILKTEIELQAIIKCSHLSSRLQMFSKGWWEQQAVETSTLPKWWSRGRACWRRWRPHRYRGLRQRPSLLLLPLQLLKTPPRAPPAPPPPTTSTCPALLLLRHLLGLRRLPVGLVPPGHMSVFSHFPSEEGLCHWACRVLPKVSAPPSFWKDDIFPSIKTLHQQHHDWLAGQGCFTCTSPLPPCPPSHSPWEVPRSLQAPERHPELMFKEQAKRFSSLFFHKPTTPSVRVASSPCSARRRTGRTRWCPWWPTAPSPSPPTGWPASTGLASCCGGANCPPSPTSPPPPLPRSTLPGSLRVPSVLWSPSTAARRPRVFLLPSKEPLLSFPLSVFNQRVLLILIVEPSSEDSDQDVTIYQNFNGILGRNWRKMQKMCFCFLWCNSSESRLFPKISVAPLLWLDQDCDQKVETGLPDSCCSFEFVNQRISSTSQLFYQLIRSIDKPSSELHPNLSKHNKQREIWFSVL